MAEAFFSKTSSFSSSGADSKPCFSKTLFTLALIVSGVESLITTAATREDPSLLDGEAQPAARTSSQKIMKELTSPGWIKLKGFLFLIIGLASASLLVLDNPALKTVILLAITVWCFCRFYYFAFYVIQHYVDEHYRFSGLWSFAGYLWRRRRNKAD